jgi:hypothetical protein
VLEQSILAEANLNQILSTHRQDSKKSFINDSPNTISFAPHVDPRVFKSVQQQLSVALGDKDSSTDTKLYKQVSKRGYYYALVN